MKTCSKCGETKPLDAFYRSPRCRDGREGSCRECRKAANAAWIAANRDRRQATRDAWREAHPEHAKVWRAANPDRVREQRIAYYREHRAEYAAGARRRKIRLRDGVSEPYTLAEIVARDGADCALCGEPLDLSLAWPDPRSVSIDHLLPTNIAAIDVLANVRLVHLRENLSRLDTLDEDAWLALVYLTQNGYAADLARLLPDGRSTRSRFVVIGRDRPGADPDELEADAA